MATVREETAPEQVGKVRVEALSDGVFAIVVTLLVLEIKVPHVGAHGSIAELAGALLALAPKFVSWVISFVTVCVMWVNHHRLFALMRRIDNGLFWRAANLLLWTSFIPFPTAVMGDYPANPLAASFYGGVMFLMAAAFVLVRWHLHRHPYLIQEGVDGWAFRTGTRYSILIGPVAFVCYAAIAAYFVLPHASRVPSERSRD